MTFRRNLTATAVLLSCLSGCSLLSDEQTETAENTPSLPVMNVIDVRAEDRAPSPAANEADADSTDSFGAVGQPQLYSSVQGAYQGRPLTHHVGDYVRNMAQDLVSNMEYVSNKTPVAVTNFALLDSDLQHTNLLGHQMAESFMHELHKYRIPVVDFKATDYIRVTDDGDFLLSRDYLDLSSSLPVDYVLTGTMAKHQGGVLVNARILGIESRAVVASAQLLIPFYVVDALIPSDSNGKSGIRDGVKLTRG
ncbi:FlgO family outer membrane protein [Alteromonas confluentis]|uniref:FlgO domain-containing protein n=1 Tax=Alteromonas confluentis TaxID=1656094 RepID=A0A1E7ZC09_9ALTE|nr:FlgO family outer membrane protein [Alteromonas confluentis]OFC70984.1 hypothetical protein BFC18_11150 [Alteromonas confluentis]